MVYKYINSDAPKEKINYSYSKFGGKAFLEAWSKSRKIIYSNKNDNYSLNVTLNNETEKLFIRWHNEITTNTFTEFSNFYLLIKRFEVTKKIYASYDEHFRPKGKNMFNEYRLYILFALLLTVSYSKYRKLQFLNSLLKVNDINTGIINSLNKEDELILVFCMKKEREFIDLLRKKLK